MKQSLDKSASRLEGAAAVRWRPLHLLAALEAVALALPTTLGGVMLVFAQVGTAYLASGILAAMLGLVLLHLLSLSSTRPAMFAARLFEATTLAAILGQLRLQLPGWGLQDTPEVRMAFLCLIAAGAGLVTGVLYLLRADRLTRYIPAPVFSGFSNSIAALLLMSQLGTLLRLWQGGESAWLLAVLAVTAATCMLGSRLRLPTLPAAAVGLGVGALLAQALGALGHPSLTLAGGALPTTVPLMLADFHALSDAAVRHLAVLGHVLVQAFILGVMAFINTTVTLEAVSLRDGQRFVGVGPRLLQSLGVSLASLLGSPVLTVSQQASLAAQRTVRLRPVTVFWTALLFALAYASGLVLWMPVAAVCGVMLADAWFFVDRGSARQLGRWLTRKPLSANAREDLALVVAVTFTAVAVNMVVAVVVGIVLGLLLFAMRNARKPVRHVWSGHQVRSNCARPRAELLALDAVAHHIKVFELEGDLFFASAGALQETVEAQVQDGQWVVLDWSRTRHVDTSVVQVVARLHSVLPRRHVVLLHAGVRASGPLAEAMADAVPPGATHADLDRALEVAENALLVGTAGRAQSPDGGAPEATVGFLRGLDEADRQRLVAAMRTVRYRAGQTVLREGDPSDELMLVLEGSASVVVRGPQGADIRLSTVLPGATLGEIGFLDRAPRSAEVVATTDLVLACLDRAQFDQMGADHPRIVQRLLANIAVDIAARLRSVSAMVAARNRV
ncbi:cyclic nucleotide-binding domain-containing protein [Hydrogenophaga sp. OTU3427]|uniref:cyclic nucleotide-binding domain-containing protein n=1 Tax=Hydrogenophaga sp. OTU3427 TaxID=3043856 RepID=UPI00313CCB04